MILYAYLHLYIMSDLGNTLVTCHYHGDMPVACPKAPSQQLSKLRVKDQY